MSRMRRALFISLICLLAGTAAAAGGKGSPLDADEQAIRAADATLLAAAAAKNVERIASFYAEDCAVLWPDSPPRMGRQGARDAWSEAFKEPSISVTWHTEQVVVARSGDLAYSRGYYDETYDENGRAMHAHGKFLLVWKKQSNGAWRVAVDVDNPDGPAQPTRP
jgi:uncharacterized protein (TIGR02246 family)